MAKMQPPSPDFTVQRSTKGGSGMTPPTADASTRRTPGRTGMAPVAASAKTRTTPGGKNLTPPSAEVPASDFVDPVATRATDSFKPKKAG